MFHSFYHFLDKSLQIVFSQFHLLFQIVEVGRIYDEVSHLIRLYLHNEFLLHKKTLQTWHWKYSFLDTYLSL